VNQASACDEVDHHHMVRDEVDHHHMVRSVTVDAYVRADHP
jgi:hypothetical protein